MYVSNFNDVITELSRAGMPEFFARVCLRKLRRGEKEFNVLHHGVYKEEAFFIRAGMRVQNNEAHFLGFGATCIDNFKHGKYGGVDTRKLCSMIQIAYHDMVGEPLKLDELAVAKMRLDIAGQLSRLQAVNMDIFLKIKEGFDVPFVLSAKSKIALEKLYDGQIKHCWFDQSLGLKVSDGYILTSERTPVKSFLVHESSPAHPSGVWVSAVSSEEGVSGKLSVKTLPADPSFTVSDVLSRFNLKKPFSFTGAIKLLEKGRSIVVFPKDRSVTSAIWLTADPWSKSIHVADFATGKKMEPAIFYKPKFKQQFLSQEDIAASPPKQSAKQPLMTKKLGMEKFSRLSLVRKIEFGPARGRRKR